MDIDKEDVKWLVSLIIPIIYEELKRFKANKKKTPKPKPDSKKKRS